MVMRTLVSVVDDDESVRESLPDLRELGFAVQAFSSAEEFLGSGCVSETKCLVLDIAMPGMSGPDLQDELLRRRQEIPIVFITAHRDETVRPRALARGALLFVHQYDSAAAMLRLASELGPTLPLSYMWLTWTELNARRYDSAEQAARQGAQAAGLDPQVYTPMIRGVADPARRRNGLAALASIPETAPWSLSADYRMNWYILLGDTTAALRALEGLKTRASLFSVLNLWNPALDPIRQHPRFRSTLEKLGLPFHGTEP